MNAIGSFCHNLSLVRLGQNLPKEAVFSCLKGSRFRTRLDRAMQLLNLAIGLELRPGDLLAPRVEISLLFGPMSKNHKRSKASQYWSSTNGRLANNCGRKEEITNVYRGLRTISCR
jgi:hypothetical protein